MTPSTGVYYVYYVYYLYSLGTVDLVLFNWSLQRLSTKYV